MRLRQLLILALFAIFSTGGTFTCKSGGGDDGDEGVVVVVRE